MNPDILTNYLPNQLKEQLHLIGHKLKLLALSLCAGWHMNKLKNSLSSRRDCCTRAMPRLSDENVVNEIIIVPCIYYVIS